jgi:hypothetical protein
MLNRYRGEKQKRGAKALSLAVEQVLRQGETGRAQPSAVFGKKENPKWSRAA